MDVDPGLAADAVFSREVEGGSLRLTPLRTPGRRIVEVDGWPVLAPSAMRVSRTSTCSYGAMPTSAETALFRRHPRCLGAVSFRSLCGSPLSKPHCGRVTLAEALTPKVLSFTFCYEGVGQMATARIQQHRRLRRHEQTRDEIIGHAFDILETQGIAQLSLGELARRMGVRTPSLYTYFDSKSALFDELFQRGWNAAYDAYAAHTAQTGPLQADTDIVERGLDLLGFYINWAMTHASLTVLLISRPIPDWEPSPEAYAASLRFFQLLVDEVHGWLDLGLVRQETDPDELIQNITSISAGIISRQLGNEPGVPFAEGRASRHLPALFTAYLRSYLP